jgi:hypothetical protein
MRESWKIRDGGSVTTGNLATMMVEEGLSV